jgi:hypothetical protein
MWDFIPLNHTPMSWGDMSVIPNPLGSHTTYHPTNYVAARAAGCVVHKKAKHPPTITCRKERPSETITRLFFQILRDVVFEGHRLATAQGPENIVADKLVTIVMTM